MKPLFKFTNSNKIGQFGHILVLLWDELSTMSFAAIVIMFI